MVEPTGGAFPFGRPVLRRKPSAKSRRRLFVLGAYPGALYIAWWSPLRKGIKALAVDNEPTNFWAAEDERKQIDAWKAGVHFRVGEWGEVETSDANGKSGRWVDEHVLAPLRITRDEACFSYCLDTYHCPNPGIAFGVEERYQPFAREAGLPEARLEPRLREGGFVEQAVLIHRERLLKELSVVVPEIVVTLGGASQRVLRAVAELPVGRRLRPDASYGVEQPLTVGGRSTRWIALCDPTPSAEYEEVHAGWQRGRI